MQLSRVNFLRLFFLIAIAPIGTMLGGCPSFGSVINEIKAWLPMITKSVSMILGLLGSVGIIASGPGTAAAALIVTIDALVVDVLNAIDEYENDPAADKQTLWGKIKTALSAIADNVSDFVANLPIAGSTIATIVETLIALFLNTISGFITAVPSTAGTASRVMMARQTKVGSNVVVLSPKVLSRKAYANAFNAALGANYKQFCIY